MTNGHHKHTGQMVQVTRYDLNKNAAAEKERSKKEAAERDMQSRREVDESTYAQQVERVNDNTLDGVDARNVDQALSQLGLEECVLPVCLRFDMLLDWCTFCSCPTCSVASAGIRDQDTSILTRMLCRKPKMKFSQYMERDLPALKESKPGLKAPQYKVRIFLHTGLVAPAVKFASFSCVDTVPYKWGFLRSIVECRIFCGRNGSGRLTIL